MNHDTSLTLLEQLSNDSDDESWARLVALYSPLLRGWLVRYDIQDADADDLVQDVLLVAIRELPSFRHSQQTGAFRSWLRGILINRLRNFWRKRGRVDLASGDSDLARRLNEFEDPHSQLTRIWDREHDRYLTRKLLELIEPRFADTTRNAFRRLVLDGASADVVAAELDMSLNAVFTAKSRVLRELRRLGTGLID
jgi:RNA polymerase sigma-70 factor (ECF subfamily)